MNTGTTTAPPSTFGAEERRLLDDSLQSFYNDRYGFEHFRSLTPPHAGPGFDRNAWTAYAEMGWLGIAVAEDLGGAGGGLTELGIVLAAAGRHLALEPFVATLVLGAGALAAAGSTPQRARVEAIVNGQTLLALCHAEPDGGYARNFVHTTATPTADGYRLDGRKAFTLHAHAADSLIVTARIGAADGPLVMFELAPDRSGVALTAAPALDGRRGAALLLQGVTVAAESLLGEVEDDRQALVDTLLDRAAIAVCAEAAGAMAAATERTVEYLKSRQQFGQSLARFQVLQHRLVDMSIAAEETRATVHAALDALDRQDPDSWRAVARAKVRTARAARFVGGQAVQLHGGMGMTDELAIGHYYKRLSLCEAQFGDAGWYLSRLAEAAEI